MNKLKFAGLIASLAVLGGCSNFNQQPDPNDEGIMVVPDKIELSDAPPTVQLPDDIPEWYINLPRDNEEKIYGSGAGLSSDLQFSIDKAMHQAKIVLGDKISSNVSAEIKTYMADNSSIGQGVTVEETQRVSKSGFRNIDVSSYEIVNKYVYRERNKFRSFILLSLDITNKDDRVNTDITTPVDINAINRAQDEARETLSNL
jgi:hypothetical protein